MTVLFPVRKNSRRLFSSPEWCDTIDKTRSMCLTEKASYESASCRLHPFFERKFSLPEGMAGAWMWLLPWPGCIFLKSGEGMKVKKP